MDNSHLVKEPSVFDRCLHRCGKKLVKCYFTLRKHVEIESVLLFYLFIFYVTEENKIISALLRHCY